MQVTNNSEGPRGINVMVNKQPQQLILQPGETQDVTLVDENCPVFKGLVRSRELLVEQPQAAGPAPTVKNEDGPPERIALQDDKQPENKDRKPDANADKSAQQDGKK